jgi:hypothetical protein
VRLSRSSGRAVTEPVKAAARWPEPSKFKSADDRQRVADALARLRPSWALPWLAQALVGTQARYTKLRHFFASRLILAAGGLMEAAEALGKDLLLDEKIIDLVTTSDADAGAKLRADAAKLKLGRVVSSGFVSEPPPHQVVAPLDHAAVMREAAWSDADEALGHALRDMGFMARSFEQLESAVDAEAAERVRRATRAIAEPGLGALPFSAQRASFISASRTSCSAVWISGFRNSLSSLSSSLTGDAFDLIFVTVMVVLAPLSSGDLHNHRTYHDRFNFSAFAEPSVHR